MTGRVTGPPGARRTVVLRLVIGILVLLAAPISGAAADPFDHGAFDALAKKHVRWVRGGVASTVDYRGFARDRASLRGYLARAGAVSEATFSTWPKTDQLAFLINVYNAATIDLVLTKYPGLESIKDLGGLFSSPWGQDVVTLFGEAVSLDDVEHTWIRKRGNYRDARIHFAVNCASVGCPALRPEAYSGARLDAQLEDQTRRFLRDRSRNRLRGNALYVSKIFDWYEVDFEQGWNDARSVGQFLARRADALGLTAAQANALRAGDLEIEYTEYNWSLND